jgi:CBS domain-containing protein
MTRLGTDCAIVDLPGGEMGIVTDRDLRSRVVAAELPPDAPVSHVMTAPAYSVSADRLGAEVLFDMLERGIRHALILTRDGRLAGVVEDSDLFTLQPRSWFHARRAIERAADTAELAAVVQRLPAIVADLHAASVAAEEVARVISALVDAAVVRASALAATTLELPAEGVVWLALGSHARRELTLLSRPIGALAADVALPAEFLARLAETIEACGVPGMVTARPTASWEAAPLSDALAVALLVERRPLWGVPTGPLPALPAARREELLDALAARARAAAPPTGFDGARVIAPDGTRSTRLELARTVLRPITTLARWAGACAGAQDGSTPERLAAAARADVLSEPEAARLTEAFTFTFSLRVAHHAELVSAGAPLVDAIDTAGLTPTTRDGLREAFRAIAAVQARLARR